MSTPSDPFIGALLDQRFRIDSLIAKGGMATVYRGTDTRLGRPVAVKILSGTYAQDADFVNRFVQEARSAAVIMHPNVVAVHDQGLYQGFPFLVMEYVPGRTLREVLHESRTLASAHALEIMRSVLAGLASAHAAGFIHRDIKPENVLLTESGLVKLTDFGLARVISDIPVSDSTGAVLLGTMAYLSPEQVLQQRLDQRSDVYSAGILLFEMLTGRVPFTGNSPLDVAYKHVNSTVPAPSMYQPDIPPAIDHLVLAATQRDPNNRLQSAEEFLDAVNRAATAVPPAEALTTVIPMNPTIVMATPPAPVQPAIPAFESTKKKKPIGLVLGAIAVVVIGYFGYQMTGGSVPMPNVINKTSEEAQSAITAAELKFVIEEQFSEDVPAGSVIQTKPGAETKTRKGKEVTLVVSKGPERYIIPADLAGQDPNAASDALKALTLDVTGTKDVFDDKIEKGKVVGTDPKAGSQVKRASEVTILVSKGPAPVEIPKILGTDIQKVTTDLGDLGLTVVIADQVFDDSAAGQVISSDPVPGTKVPKGTQVKVTISKGPALVVVPNVVGKKTDEAKKTLEALGFVVTTENKFSYVVLNEVWEQSVKGGSSAPKGSTIVLKIA